jgi:curved DNA-binding protein CbpA
MNELDQYYRELGLEPGASLEEVNQAYKDLAFIWHPDRIPKDNARLVSKAQDKLKQINEARDRLRSTPKNPHPSDRSSSGYQTHKSSAGYTYSNPPHSSDRTNAHAHAQGQSQWRSHKPHNPDLTGADLRGQNLREKDLSGRNLSHANLSQADLSDGFLHKINLSGANLQGANLFRANLLQANLTYANLQNVNLIGADLSGADLTGADLRGAKMGTKDRLFVKLIGTKLTGAIMPDGRIHE